jgi:hypothetical protein
VSPFTSYPASVHRHASSVRCLLATHSPRLPKRVTAFHSQDLSRQTVEVKAAGAQLLQATVYSPEDRHRAHAQRLGHAGGCQA